MSVPRPWVRLLSYHFKRKIKLLNVSSIIVGSQQFIIRTASLMALSLHVLDPFSIVLVYGMAIKSKK